MKYLKNKNGFTLIEMMVVLTIISILLLIVIPNMTKSQSVAKSKSCDATIRLLQSQVAAYEMETGTQLTDSLQPLLDDHYVESITCPGKEVLVLDSDGNVIKQ